MRNNTDLLLVLVLVLAAMLLVVGGMSVASHEPPPVAAYRPPAPAPLQRPILTEAIGRVESGMQPGARGKHGERGAFQIQAHYWGKVPAELHAQALQHEWVLDELLRKCGGRVGREAICIALLEREVGAW